MCIRDSYYFDVDSDGHGSGSSTAFCDATVEDGWLLDSDDNCPDDANPGQEDLDGDDIGDICDPCNGLVYVLGNVNGDANEGYDPIVDVIDLLALSDYLEDPVYNECQMLDLLEDGEINQWDLIVLADLIMNGGS